jgi:hypothetical protein
MENCEKRRMSATPGMLRLFVLSVFCGLLLIGCSNSPQSKFEGKLDKLFDNLIENLKAYAAGDTSVEKDATATWYQNGQYRMNPHTSMSVDRSLDIISTAKAIQDQFGSVSLAFLSQDPTDIDHWGKSFKKRYNARRAEVGKLLDKIKKRYRAHPQDYVSDIYGPTLGLSRDGHLFFRQGSTGYYIDAMIDIDIDKWLAAVKEKMQELK